MCDVAGWPVGAGAEVCAKTVPPPIAEERSIALTSDFIANSSSNDDAPTPIDRSRLPLPESWSSPIHSSTAGDNVAPYCRSVTTPLARALFLSLDLTVNLIRLSSGNFSPRLSQTLARRA